MSVRIQKDFPGANIKLDAVHVQERDGQRFFQIALHQELRDTPQDWFYWNFALSDYQPGDVLDFTFTQSRALGVHGPAYSLNNGETWAWLGANPELENAFTFTVPDDVGIQERGLRFAFAVPYVLADWEQFLSNFVHSDKLQAKKLCDTKAGRVNPYYELTASAAEPAHKVLLTARHHCCEMVANLVLEGFLNYLHAGDEPESQYLSEHVSFFMVPFVDLDGVENGDQGKMRAPRDHGRDYAGESIYPSCAAIRELVTQWGVDKLHATFDIHCPWIDGDHNEVIYLVGKQEPEREEQQRVFSQLLESANQGELNFSAEDFLPFGTAWNTNTNTTDGAGITYWANQLPGVRLTTAIEMPYAHVRHNQQTEGVQVTQENARAFGADFGRAMARYLQTL